MNNYVKVRVNKGGVTEAGIRKFLDARDVVRESWAAFARKFSADEAKFFYRTDFDGQEYLDGLVFSSEVTQKDGFIFKRYAGGTGAFPGPLNRNPGRKIAAEMKALPRKPGPWNVGKFIDCASGRTVDEEAGRWHYECGLEMHGDTYILAFWTDGKSIPRYPADCTPITEIEYLELKKRTEAGE